MIDGPRRSRWAVWPSLKGLKRELGVKAIHRAATETDGTFTLREPREAYTSVFAGENDVLRLDNSRFYEEKSVIQGT